MKKKRVYLLSSIVALLMFSCVNNSYDLSDIDSTVGVKVNDLIVPLNIDAIKLQNMLNLDDDSQVKVINGEYAFLEESTFESDPIEVPSFKIPDPNITPIKETLNLISYDFSTFPISIPNDYRIFSAEVNEASTSFNFEVQSIDPTLVKMDEIGTNFLMNITLSVSGLESILDSIEIENLAIQLPKGLKATVSDKKATYNSSTGLLTYSNFNLINASQQDKLLKGFTISVSKIDAKQAGLELANGKLTLKTITSLSGKFSIYGRNLKESIDMTLLEELKTLTYQFDINFPNGDIEVTDFTGDLQYQFDGINVSPVFIDDMPNLLNQEGTDIRIANPQIYLSINNPLYNDYQLKAEAGIELIPTPKNDLTFESNLTFDKEMNQFCLSPTQPEKMHISGSTFVPFTNLGDILSGDELPSKIDIEIIHPEVPQQTVRNFQLGQNLGTVKGSYVFYAPFALTADAQIHYTDTLDGWNDDELKNLTVNVLTIKANIQSDIPFGFKAIAYPINKNGDKLTKNGKTIEAILQSIGPDGKTHDMLPALANTSILINMEGPLKDIDGIILKAILSGAEGNHSLKPNQKIQLTNIQMKVSGEYINEF